MSRMLSARIVGARLIAPWPRFEPVGATRESPMFGVARIVGAQFIAPFAVYK